MSPFYFSILFLLHVQKSASIIHFYTFPKTSFRGFIHHNIQIVHNTSWFTSTILHENCFRFFPGKRDWRQFAYAKFLGVNKVFYGQCENGEYVNNFYLYIYFLISQIKNVRSTFPKISFVQSPFKNCLALLFFSLLDLK